jgi:hypothetical protein
MLEGIATKGSANHALYPVDFAAAMVDVPNRYKRNV